MLVINDLSTAIKNKISGLADEQRNNSLAVHSAYADTIVEYLSDNIEIHGVYAGTTSGSPDPLNGPYVWDGKNMALTGQDIKNGADGSWMGWRNAVRDGIRTIEAVGEDNGTIPVITLTEPVPPATPPNLGLYVLNYIQTDMNKVNNFDGATDILAEKIINSFAGVLPDPISVAATSTGGGSGTVVFTLIQ